MRTAAALAALVIAASPALAQNCTALGSGNAICDNGTYYQQQGNILSGTDGSRYERIGPNTFDRSTQPSPDYSPMYEPRRPDPADHQVTCLTIGKNQLCR